MAAAADNGTALALLYALQSDPEPQVRAAIVRTMGTQRLRGYEPALVEHLRTERDADVEEEAKRALAEIRRDPVDSKPAAKPE